MEPSQQPTEVSKRTTQLNRLTITRQLFLTVCTYSSTYCAPKILDQICRYEHHHLCQKAYLLKYFRRCTCLVLYVFDLIWFCFPLQKLLCDGTRSVKSVKKAVGDVDYISAQDQMLVDSEDTLLKTNSIIVQRTKTKVKQRKPTPEPYLSYHQQRLRISESEIFLSKSGHR